MRGLRALRIGLSLRRPGAPSLETSGDGQRGSLSELWGLRCRLPEQGDGDAQSDDRTGAGDGGGSVVESQAITTGLEIPALSAGLFFLRFLLIFLRYLDVIVPVYL